MRGEAHEEAGTPCQDSHAVLVEGDVLIAAVADGAGTAAKSDVGSSHLARRVTELLRDAARERGGSLAALDLLSLVNTEAVAAVRRCRTELSTLEGAELSDYHATMVGCIANETGGVLFHIGDGAACAMSVGDLRSYVVSPPENGPFAETTFFFTEQDWEQHFRVTPFGPQFDTIALMTDGATPFALSGAHAPTPDFFNPVTRFLSASSRSEGEIALAATLDCSSARLITTDDKTLVWARRCSDV